MKYNTENQYSQDDILSSCSLILLLAVLSLLMSSLKALFNSLTVLLFSFLSLFSLTIPSDSSLQFLFAEIPHTFLCVLHFSLQSLQYTNQSFFFFNFPRSSKAGQKAIVDGISSRPPKGYRDPFFDPSLALVSALELFLGPNTEFVITSCPYKIHFFITHHNLITKQFVVFAYNKRRLHFKMIFLICGQLMRHLLIEFFHLSDLLQMPTDGRKVDAEIFDNFWCSCKRISLDDPLNWLPLTSDIQPLCSSFSSLSSFAKLLEPPVLYIHQQFLGQMHC